MRRLALLATLLVVLSCVLPVVAFSQNTIDSGPPLVNYLRTNINDTAPGDRINCLPKDLAEWIPAALPKDSYQVGSGDVLTVNVKGKANLNYHVNDESKTDANPDEATVTPGGEIYLPLVGKISVAGKTVSGIESIVKARLGKYIKSFDVTVTVSKIRTVNVWIGGEVDNPGPRIMPTLSTATLAALQSSIKPTGSTRRITLVRGKDRKTVDLYKMSITGDVSGDIPLQPGDSVYIPPVTDYVEIDGEITRPGKYEMFAVTGGSGSFTVRDLVELSLGLTPSAAKDKAYIERIGDDGLKKLVNLDLRDMAKGKDANLALQPGDKLKLR
jgi:protein involved in polysaccharide export with SLBB domain